MKPIYDLLKNEVTSKGQLNSKSLIKWEQKHQVILSQMIENLRSPQLISYPDFSKPKCLSKTNHSYPTIFRF